MSFNRILLRLAKIADFPLFFRCFFNFFRFFGILVRVGLQDASKTPSRRPQEPPRRPQEPPRRSKMPPRHSCGRPKNIDFPCVFQGFRCPGPAWSYLGPTWPPRRLQEPLERVPRLPRRLQESLRRLQRPPRHPQEPPRCSQDTSPRSPKIENFIMLFNLLAFLGLLGGSSLNMVVKTLPRCLQEPPKCA